MPSQDNNEPTTEAPTSKPSEGTSDEQQSHSHKVDTLGLDGVDYDIKGLPLEEIARDVAQNTPTDVLIKKWGLEKRKLP